MFDHSFRGAILLLLGIATMAPAHADGPKAGFKLNAEETVASPDQSLRVEQYSKELKDQAVLYQFWTFDRDHQHPSLLNPGENDELAGYPAGFRFSPDSQWLVRMQKLGAGYHTLFLYRRQGNRFTAATKKPFGDLAWDYFFSLPVSRSMHRDPKDRYSLDHQQANLLKGMEENYAWLGLNWADSRYVVIGLSFDIQGAERPTPWIEGWWCVYDLKTTEFSVPSAFAVNNARALKTPGFDQD